MHDESEACWQRRGCETHNSDIGVNDMADCTAVLLTELHETQVTAHAACLYTTECKQP